MRLIGLLLMVASMHVNASADCPVYPKEEWAKKTTLRQGLEEEGYKIKVLHTNGNCYEIYGFNKAGKKVEIYFDMKTLAIVKAEIEK